MLHDVLFELGTEELPSGSVLPLTDALKNALIQAFEKQGLQHQGMFCFATPRRMAVMIKQVQAMQADQAIVRRGPAYAAGMSSDGTPLPALLGFAKSCGVDVSILNTVETDKGRWWTYDTVVVGRPTRALLPDIIQEAVAALSIAKPMRWGMGEMSFVRPVHWAVLLLGDEIIETDVLGCRTGRLTRGHRFHHPQTASIASPCVYEEVLRAAYVIADFEARRQLIEASIQRLAASVGARAVIPQDLLLEVTSIVEWPQALLVNFDPVFLDVPAEALIAAMQVHQKCFALRNKEGALLPYFIAVSNIESKDPARVIAGNERVMRARLSDADFFYRQDKKKPLSDYAEAAAHVVFQAKLGSLKDKAKRIEALMDYCVPFWGLDQSQASRAAVLCKADLMTAMVGEFPELQGLMGYYYAKHDGESEAVALALNEQYMPRFAADGLPLTPLGFALSLTDRLDTLVGAFSLGLKPTGVKDPFKLRRHALAVVRLLTHASTQEPLHLSSLLKCAFLAYQGHVVAPEGIFEELQRFILDRLPSSYQGTTVGVDLILAVKACQSDCLFDMNQRIMALQNFLIRPEAVVLASACKRVDHLLQHVDINKTQDRVDDQRLEKEAEKDLLSQINILEKEVATHLFSTRQPSKEDYDVVLTQLAGLREPIDSFFEQVMVMVDDEALRMNRLRLLSKLQALLRCVADLSLLSSIG